VLLVRCRLDRLPPKVDVGGERRTSMRLPDDAREVDEETQPAS
jgi:hypothetical protein